MYQEETDMTEKCPYCGNDFANSKALGSHIHYVHSSVHAEKGRSEADEERFRSLLNSCLSDRGLRRPRHVGKIEKAIAEIPEGVSPALDQYRNAFECAPGKEKLLEEVEELLKDEESGKSG